MAIQLILGGARSGKSGLAERLAAKSSLQVTYVATAQAGDEEMARRIKEHRARRPQHWDLVEEPLYLAEVLSKNSQTGRLLLVDCLTLWLNNLLLHEESSVLWPQEKEKLLEVLPTLESPIIMVGNETGLGVVPMGALSRRFVDESGWLHQDLAQISQRVIFTVAGLPTVLKGEAL